MGNILRSELTTDPDSSWKAQNSKQGDPAYKFAGLGKGHGILIDAYNTGGPEAVAMVAKSELFPILYNRGHGRKVTKEDVLLEMYKTDAKNFGINNKKKKNVSFKPENQHLIIEDHEVCWDLQKRGAVGETALHLCYLIDSEVHLEVAKVLLQMFPKLALDIYEGLEYYGESALHIAVVYGDFEAVKLLVTNGANVNQRATGRFFLPDDQKSGQKPDTNYLGDAYYGEYPVAFAACFGNEEIYDYLILHGADPNLQDSFGNTVLHMVVIADQLNMYKYVIRHYQKPAKVSTKNNAKLTPLKLASKLGRHMLFKEMLELSSTECWRFSDTQCSIHPLDSIDSIGANGVIDWQSSLMFIIHGNTDEHLDMLDIGVIRQLLDDKWKTFGRRRFVERLIMTMLHLLLISIAVYTRPAKDLLTYKGPQDAVRFAAEIIVCCGCLATLGFQAGELRSAGTLGFFKNCISAPAKTIFMLSCILILLCIPLRFLDFHTVEDILLILAVPGSWFYLLFFARGVKLTGPFVTMIYKMIVGDLFRFAIIYIIFLVGFTQGFYFLFRDIPASRNVTSFESLPTTVMTLFQMTLGEFRYEEFNESNYSALTKLMFAVFMILVPILLLNMLIATMGNTYQQVMSRSDKEWRKQWSKLVLVFERGCSKKQLRKYQMEYSIKMDPVADSDKPRRGLMVIKICNKTRAKQRKGAVSNWKAIGNEIIRQVKVKNKAGKEGMLKVQRRGSLIKRPRRASRLDGFPMLMEEDRPCSADSNRSFTSAVAKLAWMKDIDLTKSQSVNLESSLDESIIAKTELPNQNIQQKSTILTSNKVHPIAMTTETDATTTEPAAMMGEPVAMMTELVAMMEEPATMATESDPPEKLFTKRTISKTSIKTDSSKSSTPKRKRKKKKHLDHGVSSLVMMKSDDGSGSHDSSLTKEHVSELKSTAEPRSDSLTFVRERTSSPLVSRPSTSSVNSLTSLLTANEENCDSNL